MEQGWDPDVKRFFVRILNTISLGTLWLMLAVAGGLYFKLAYDTDHPIGMIIYYIIILVTLFFLIRHLYKIWK